MNDPILAIRDLKMHFPVKGGVFFTASGRSEGCRWSFSRRWAW